MRTRLKAAGLAMAGLAGRGVRVLPGLLALVCAVVGVFILFGAGWAFLAAVPFLLLLDRRS